MSATINGWLRAALAGLILVAASPASALMIQCDHCDETQMVQRLRDLAGAGLGLEGTVHVADFAGDALRAFAVECNHWGWPQGGDPRGDGQRPGGGLRWWACTQLIVTPTVVLPAGSEQYAVLREFHQDTGGTWQKQFSNDLSSGDLGGPHAGSISGYSAFDIAASINARHLVGSALANHCSSCFATWFGQLLNYLSSAIINAPASIIVRIVFADGTRASFIFRAGENLVFTYIPGSAEMSDGQLIPDIEQLAQPGFDEWSFGPGGGEGLIGHFERVRPGFVGPAPPSGGAYRLVCTWDGSTINCTIIPV